MTTKNDRMAWLKGGAAQCSTPPAVPQKIYRFVLLGAPGVGKGTQAELLAARLGVCHLSTGDVFRAAKSLCASERTPALNDALDCMKRGGLVTDQTVLDMVTERARCLRCHGGFLLDGFPRTLMQAEALDRLLAREQMPITAVFNYELPLEQVVARLGGRRTCSGCKAVYHVTTLPSRVPDVCDRCGGKLIQREDDRPESIRVRMAAYEESTLPLKDFYAVQNLLVSVTAEGTPEDIYARSLQALAKLNGAAKARP